MAEIFYHFDKVFFNPKSIVLCPKMVLPLDIKSCINFPYSVSCYVNVIFIHSTIRNGLPALQIKKMSKKL